MITFTPNNAQMAISTKRMTNKELVDALLSIHTIWAMPADNYKRQLLGEAARRLRPMTIDDIAERNVAALPEWQSMFAATQKHIDDAPKKGKNDWENAIDAAVKECVASYIMEETEAHKSVNEIIRKISRRILSLKYPPVEDKLIIQKCVDFMGTKS
jgi:hypothetical protein